MQYHSCTVTCTAVDHAGCYCAQGQCIWSHVWPPYWYNTINTITHTHTHSRTQRRRPTYLTLSSTWRAAATADTGQSIHVRYTVGYTVHARCHGTADRNEYLLVCHWYRLPHTTARIAVGLGLASSSSTTFSLAFLDSTRHNADLRHAIHSVVNVPQTVRDGKRKWNQRSSVKHSSISIYM